MARSMVSIVLPLAGAVCAYAVTKQLDLTGLLPLNEENLSLSSDIPDPADVGVFVLNHIYHATLNDTYPTTPLFRIGSPSLESYKLIPCDRKDVGTCLRRGELCVATSHLYCLQ
jgi:hypothetical protein